MTDTTALRTGLSAVALLLTTACSVLPKQDFPPFDEREVVVRYELSRVHTTAVRVPASGTDLTVLWMHTEPADLRETFEGGMRRLHPDFAAEDSTHDDINELVIRCRYRAYERPSPDAGQRGLPAPEELFPGASSIETVWHRDQRPRELMNNPR